jgi:hypothetical protein
LLGTGLLADKTERTDPGKLNAYGVITVFWAWGFPCFRKAQAVVTLFSLPQGDTHIVFSLGGPGIEEPLSLGKAEVKASEPNHTMTLDVPIASRFAQPGLYHVIAQFSDRPGRITIPFEIRLKEWPTFTKEEIEFARSNPNVPHTLGARVQCRGCENDYAFEESLLEDFEPSGDVLRFPESGVFECTECDYTLQLRDLHGQARAILKTRLKEAMEQS